MTTTLAAAAELTDTAHADDLARRLEPLLPAATVTAAASAGLGREAIASRALRTLARELDEPLDRLVVHACRQDETVRARCRPPDGDDAPRGQPVTICLGQQTISYVERPRVELELAGTKHALFELTLTVELAVTLLQLDVLEREIVGLHPSEAVVSVVVQAAGAEISRRQNLPVVIAGQERPAAL